MAAPNLLLNEMQQLKTLLFFTFRLRMRLRCILRSGSRAGFLSTLRNMMSKVVAERAGDSPVAGRAWLGAALWPGRSARLG
jgi:hypothetical protein